MEKMQVKRLAAQHKAEVMMTLIYQGRMPAIKLYIQYTGCRVEDAQRAIERLGQEIQPGPA